jgi:hypothetical protein
VRPPATAAGDGGLTICDPRGGGLPEGAWLLPPSLGLADRLHRTARPELAVHSADDPPNRPLTPRALGLFSPRFVCEPGRLPAVAACTLPPKRLRFQTDWQGPHPFVDMAVGEYTLTERPKSGPATDVLCAGCGRALAPPRSLLGTSRNGHPWLPRQGRCSKQKGSTDLPPHKSYTGAMSYEHEPARTRRESQPLL